MKKLIVVLLLVVGSSAAAQHGINLIWTPSVTSGVTSQLVCRSTSPGTENCATPLVTFPNNTTAAYLDTTGTPGTTYYYVLEACIGSICSVPSAEASAVFPSVPVPPSGVTASPQ